MALDPDLLLLRDDGDDEFGVSGGSGSVGWLWWLPLRQWFSTFLILSPVIQFLMLW